MMPVYVPILIYSRKHNMDSIVLQAIVDYRYCFWDINVGWHGSCHDARVLANSDLFKKAQYGNLFPALNRIIDNAQVPIMLLGDHAYPLMPWLMKPYLDNGHLARERLHFNSFKQYDSRLGLCLGFRFRVT